MSINYKINRVFLFFCTILALSFIFLTITDKDVEYKLLHVIAGFVFLYVIVVTYSFRVIVNKHSIKNVFYLFPLFSKIRECPFQTMKKISFDFFIFEESGSFLIRPNDNRRDKMVVISFFINNKKEIIQKILDARPDLKLDDWVWERVLNYKIVHKKFLFLSSILIFLCLVTLFLQHIKR